ncbi:hypothetical protein ACE1SV_62160 [Streptomyces sennicomposti]
MTARTSDIEKAAGVLRAGGLVALPTETVYGLGANAEHPAAVARIFQVKGRPPSHPLIVHIGGAEQLDDWVQGVPAPARLLAEHFWPGPLTLVLRRGPRVPLEATGGLETVAVRVPEHSARTWSAVVGLIEPKRLADGDVTPPPKVDNSARATWPAGLSPCRRDSPAQPVGGEQSCAAIGQSVGKAHTASRPAVTRSASTRERSSSRSTVILIHLPTISSGCCFRWRGPPTHSGSPARQRHG